MPSSKEHGEEPQTKTDTPVVFLAARAKLDNHLDENVYPAMRVISDRMLTDQLRSSEEPNEPGHSLNNAEAQICKRKARSVCLACGQTRHWEGDPQCPGRPVNVYISHISIGPGLSYEDDFSQAILKSRTNFFDDRDAALLLQCKIHQTTFKRKT